MANMCLNTVRFTGKNLSSLLDSLNSIVSAQSKDHSQGFFLPGLEDHSENARAIFDLEIEDTSGTHIDVRYYTRWASNHDDILAFCVKNSLFARMEYDEDDTTLHGRFILDDKGYYNIFVDPNEEIQEIEDDLLGWCCVFRGKKYESKYYVIDILLDELEAKVNYLPVK